MLEEDFRLIDSLYYCTFSTSEVHRLEILSEKDETTYTALSCTFSNIKCKARCTPDADISWDPVLTHLSSPLVITNFQSVSWKRPSLVAVAIHLSLDFIISA